MTFPMCLRKIQDSFYVLVTFTKVISFCFCSILNQLPAANSPCQSRKELPVDIIYTDIVGLRQFKKHVRGGYGKFRSVSMILKDVCYSL